jgi:hypothetical protein
METTVTTKTMTPERIIRLALFLCTGAALAAALNRLPFDAIDWYTYRDIQDFWHPYREGVVFNPPWTFWLLWPLRLLPVYQVGILRLLILLSLAALILQRGGGKWEMLALATSMPFLYLVANGNIDWLAGLAFLVKDSGLALPLLLIKPQVGIFAALAWLQKSGWRILLPTAGLLLLSLAIYGWWPAQALANIQGMENGVGLTRAEWNASIFPWGVPLGLWLIWLAWQKGDEFYGVSATLLLSPYYGHYTMAVWYALALTRLKGWAGRLGLALFWLVTWVWYFYAFLGVRW